jgi:hypothetical protein
VVITLDAKRRLTVPAALAPVKPRDYFDAHFDAERESHQRPRQQPWQLSGQRRGLINRERPFGSDRLQARHLDPTSGIRLQMPPFDRRPKNRAQHVMEGGR